MKKSKVTSHILDIEKGRPASDVVISLELFSNGQWTNVGESKTDNDGRVVDWLESDISTGHYRISFAIDEYFKREGRECFYPSASIEFYLKNTEEHYHVPLLLSAHGYSTYRGS